jgi:pSer/pThr/pTyr-binding forkhead associated (FHA) protein
VVVGRSPQLIPGDPALAIKVYSPNHDVSRTHMRIDPRGDGWLVSDLNSTNGTLVRRPGEATVIATEGAPVVAGIGTLIALGDNVVIRIDPAQAG